MGFDLDPHCSIILDRLQYSDYEKKSSESMAHVARNSDFVACAQKGAEWPAHQCRRDARI